MSSTNKIQIENWRLGWYLEMIKVNALARDRESRACWVCGLLPEEDGLKAGVPCPECGKNECL